MTYTTSLNRQQHILDIIHKASKTEGDPEASHVYEDGALHAFVLWFASDPQTAYRDYKPVADAFKALWDKDLCRWYA